MRIEASASILYFRIKLLWRDQILKITGTDAKCAMEQGAGYLSDRT